MLNFWETVRGTRLADTIIRELPKLTAKKKQYVMFVDSRASLKELKEALESGDRVVASFSVEGYTHVVLEKEDL